MLEKTDAFRSNVRKYSRLQGITQERLAEKAGLSSQWLNKMLCGKSNPTLPVCERIAKALGLSLEALVSTSPQQIAVFENSKNISEMGLTATRS